MAKYCGTIDNIHTVYEYAVYHPQSLPRYSHAIGITGKSNIIEEDFISQTRQKQKINIKKCSRKYADQKSYILHLNMNFYSINI